MKKLFLLLAMVAALCACGKTSKDSKELIRVDEDGIVVVPEDIFWNHDSVMYYAELAYTHDDPKGCFVVGACYYLRQENKLPGNIYVVSQDDADEMLMISAGQGYQPAKALIQCLQKNNCWKH